MDWLRNRWVVALGGGALALAAGLVIAWVIFAHGARPSEPPPASQGGLVIVTGRDDDARLDPHRPLRCFVGGQFVGELPLAECAKRNGVATGALDVGLDQAGALAATNGAGAELTPLNALAPAQPLPVTETGPPPANVVLPAAPPAEPIAPAPVNATPPPHPASAAPVQRPPPGQALAHPPGAL
jgi:hypothetical protein